MPTEHEPALTERIRQLLRDEEVAFTELVHPPVRTAREAAEVRGSPLEMGAKAIVFKADDRFVLLVMSAACAVRSRLVRRSLDVRRTRFATTDELAELAGVPPGAVPPFGPPILDLPLYADPSVLASEQLAFTPGTRERSILLASRDWERVARPIVVPIAEPSTR